jgi:hypothetical protein
LHWLLLSLSSSFSFVTYGPIEDQIGRQPSRIFALSWGFVPQPAVTHRPASRR